MNTILDSLLFTGFVIMLLFSYVQYSNIAARCVRNALKKDLAADAEKRALVNIKFQKFEAGKPVGKLLHGFFMSSNQGG